MKFMHRIWIFNILFYWNRTNFYVFEINRPKEKVADGYGEFL